MPTSQIVPQSNHRERAKQYILSSAKKGLFSPRFDLFMDHLYELGFEVPREEKCLLQKWYQDLLEFEFLKDIISNTIAFEIEEVIIHSCEWIQMIGAKRKEFYGPFLNSTDFQFALEYLALKSQIIWNTGHPVASHSLELFNRKWRATFVHKELSPKGNSKLFLRARKSQNFRLHDFKVSEGQKTFIEQFIKERKTIIVAGATGSGKTTFLRALLPLTSEREHIVILEDTHELESSSPFITYLLAKPQDKKRLVDLCHQVLRMRPDRLLLGEIRGNEIVPLLLSLNTGHSGLLSTIHANSSLDTLHRLCLLFQVYAKDMSLAYSEVLKLVCQGVDIIIYLENKEVKEILEVKGSEGMTPFYQMWS